MYINMYICICMYIYVYKYVYIYIHIIVWVCGEVRLVHTPKPRGTWKLMRYGLQKHLKT